eukprot:g4525.t1
MDKIQLRKDVWDDVEWQPVQVTADAASAWTEGGFLGLEVLDGSSVNVTRGKGGVCSITKKKKKKNEVKKQELTKKNDSLSNEKKKKPAENPKNGKISEHGGKNHGKVKQKAVDKIDSEIARLQAKRSKLLSNSDSKNSEDAVNTVNDTLPKKKKKKRKRNRAAEREAKKRRKRQGITVAEERRALKAEKKKKKASGQEECSLDKTSLGNENDDLDMSAWNPLGLHPILLGNLKEQGFERPTPIQSRCIAAAVGGGRDVLGAAETGSGKTLAFGLPILHRLLEEMDVHEAVTKQEKADGVVVSEEERAKRESARKVLRCLIICPTRELALQVTKHLQRVVRGSSLEIAAVVGGMAQVKQDRLLSRRPEVVVGTPGRLWQLMRDGEKHVTNLSGCNFLALDEVDRMAAPGSYPELGNIFTKLRESDEKVARYGREAAKKSVLLNDLSTFDEFEQEEEEKKSAEKNVNERKFERVRRQVLLFSATLTIKDEGRDTRRRRKTKGNDKQEGDLNDNIYAIARACGCGGAKTVPVVIDVTKESNRTALIQGSTFNLPEGLELSQIFCSDDEKDAYLYYFFSQYAGRTLIFVNAISHVKRLTILLQLLKLPAFSLHAKMQQRARLKNLDRFRKDENTILVATDVAARGLDIPRVDHVLNYHLPFSTELFVHRSGRTARANTSGLSVSLVSGKEQGLYRSTCEVLSLPEGMAPFPIDLGAMKQIHSRVNIAKQLAVIQVRASKKQSTKNWLRDAAQQADLVLDDDIEKEIAHMDEEGPEQRRLVQMLAMHLNEPLRTRRRGGMLNVKIAAAERREQQKGKHGRTAANDLHQAGTIVKPRKKKLKKQKKFSTFA